MEFFWHNQSTNLHRRLQGAICGERSETLQPDDIQGESVILSAALGSVFTRLLAQPDNEREAIQSSRRAKFPDRKWLSEVVITEDAAIPSLIK